MLISEDLAYLMRHYGSSYIDFGTPEAAEAFEKYFNKEWTKCIDKVIDENLDYGKDERKTMHSETNMFPMERNGNRVTFMDMYVLDNWGCRAYLNEPIEALEAAIKRVEEEYPGVSCEGLMAYDYSDTHGGGSVVFEVNCDKTIHPYVGEKLRLCFADDEFWEELSECDELEERKEELYLYKDYFLEDTEERLSELEE